ncbi:MAG: hypothetical protein COC06_10650 [Bacteroidales bacterium]|nr:MAG: hypothetical protein COC06_10650 [Bacteroidales bacterium]
MKRIFAFLVAVLITASLWAQSPESISYQAVIRDANNALVTNQQVGMQISILQSSAGGTAVYVETHDATTNANGLVTVEIGNGTTSDDFSTIDWAADTYFINTETDPTGGSNYTITGVSQLLSVPYALHAKTAETITGTITESDPVYTASEVSNITTGDITNLGNLSGTNTGDQDLSSFSTQIALGDSTAQVRSEIPDVSVFLTTEADPTFAAWNKTTGISITKSQITDLTHTVDTDTHIDSTGIATLGYVAGGITTETDPTFTAWNKSTGITITESQISDLAHTTDTNTQLDSTGIATLGFVAGTHTVDTNTQLSEAEVDAFVANDNYLTTEVDGDITNEIQDLQLNTTTNVLTITNNGTATTIDLNPYLDNTDTQLTEAEVDNYVSNNRYLTTDTTLNEAEVDAFVANNGYLTAEVDSSITNEIELPIQAGNSGKVLSTDGTSPSWVTETDPSVPTGITPGQMQYWNGSAWITVAAGSDGQVLTFSSGVPTWKSIEGKTDVTNPTTGKIWMDRNLGATQVATSSTDTAAYGYLYQWGRSTDGHQFRTSNTTTLFILAPEYPYNWDSQENINLWQGVSGLNNPCPSGYRLPTETELNNERLSWSTSNSAGAYASPLKLPAGGYRYFSDGSFVGVGSYGDYWSSTVSGDASRMLGFASGGDGMGNGYRACAYSVRCIKN